MCAPSRANKKARANTQAVSLCMYYRSRQCRHCLHYWRSSGVSPVCEPEPPGSWQIGLGSRRQNKHTVCTLCARIEGGKGKARKGREARETTATKAVQMMPGNCSGRSQCIAVARQSQQTPDTPTTAEDQSKCSRCTAAAIFN